MCKVADTVRGLSKDVSVLKASVTNLEVGQLTTECYMQALLEAQGISASSIQDCMVAAKQALDQSQRQRGLLGPNAKPLTQEPTTVGTQHWVLSQVNTMEETEREDKKHTRSEHVPPPTALSLSSNLSWHKKSLCDLNVTALHGILCELASSQVAEGLRHKEHVDFVAALSHYSQCGLFVVVRVIGNVSQVTPWTVQCARVCSITKKASLSWALDIAAQDHIRSGRGWSMDVGCKPLYDIPLHLVFLDEAVAQEKVDQLNPLQKQLRLHPTCALSEDSTGTQIHHTNTVAEVASQNSRLLPTPVSDTDACVSNVPREKSPELY